ncbi:hypothetical protein [Actinoplanes palleronii]|nr:hypothetical protein [Actinoplanes palleronii]
MMDLHTRLDRFGGPIETATSDTVTADLARAHRAVRRRRTARTVAGSAFGVAAIVAAVSFTGAVVGNRPGSPPAPAVAESTVAGLRLVDYRGEQPKYFTIAKVPAGFFVQNDDEGGLTIAPDAVRDPSPGVDPSKAPMYDPRDLGGKIGIYLEQRAYRDPVDGEKVTVAGHEAVLHPIGPTWQLIISVSPQVYATVQADVPLSRDQLLELGAGLRVSPEAIARMAAATGK